MSHRPKPKADPLRQRILEHCQTLGLPLEGDQLDDVLRRAEQEHISHLELVERLLSVPAQRRRERSAELRINKAKFSEPATLEAFDWKFNGQFIDRVQMEELATGEFIRRRDNLVFVGQSGLGKSHLIQAIGRRCCVGGYRVRYITSGKLLEDLTAALADRTIHDRVRFYAKFGLLIIDEFGFDRIERAVCPQAASLWYKIIDARSQRASTALVTNIDFDAWADYLGDAPLAMALLDRVVDGATIVKLKGKSYRAHRSPDKPPAK